MKLFYDLSMRAFPVFLQIAGLVHHKAKLMVEGRKNWESELKAKHPGGKVIWFHCASVGEFEQARPVIESLRKSYPGYRIAVSFFSPSGYHAAKSNDLIDLITYLPFDSRKNARKFIEILHPAMAVFIKYEFWYYFLDELKRHDIPAISVSSIFREDQRFFKKKDNIFKEMLMNFDHFFVQDEQSRRLLASIGIEHVTVSGDTRFDRVLEIIGDPMDIPLAQRFKNRRKVMVIGSSWPEDMEMIYPLVNDENIDLKFIIAPHEVEKAKVRRLCEGLKVEYTLFSEADKATIAAKRVLVIDNIGMLSSLYRYGEMAYVGGAFGDGLHNILEPAAYGIPVIFGKSRSNRKFREAGDLVSLGGAFEVENGRKFMETVQRLLKDEETLKKASGLAGDYVRSNAGATGCIMEKLHNFIKG